jgi:hypothetical protein
MQENNRQKIIEGNFFLAYQDSKNNTTQDDNRKNEERPIEPKSRPPTIQTLSADKEQHERSQEQVNLTEHKKNMDDGEKKSRSRDAVRGEVGEQSTKNKARREKKTSDEKTPEKETELSEYEQYV